ncbi:hypothetical protein CPB85DRAFT_1456404 [Mucidula mucida]|nr:hypothetical protein CPB85DRAFT_1456404 [Mucidula mucida]
MANFGTIMFTAPPSELTDELKTNYTAVFQHIPSKDDVRAVITAANQKNSTGNSGHVKRPSNSYIIFRSCMNHFAPTELFTEIENTYGSPTNGWFSKLVTHYWHKLPAHVRQFYDDMQKEVKQQHAKDHPGYKYHPAKPAKGHKGKRRKTESPKSSARVSPPPQTPVWDAALEPFQFTFQIESPLVDAPHQFTHAPLPAVNGQEHAQSRDHFAPQPFVDALSEQPGNEFYGRENFAVAGPLNQQYAHPTYALDGFNGASPFTGYTFNPIPVSTPLDLNKPLDETFITICRQLFPLEIECGINFDKLRRDDVLITSMSHKDQEFLDLRLLARASYPFWMCEF